MACFCVQVTWNDAPHLSEVRKAPRREAFPEHQRDARMKDVPVLGSGAPDRRHQFPVIEGGHID